MPTIESKEREDCQSKCLILNLEGTITSVQLRPTGQFLLQKLSPIVYEKKTLGVDEFTSYGKLFHSLFK